MNYLGKNLRLRSASPPRRAFVFQTIYPPSCRIVGRTATLQIGRRLEENWGPAGTLSLDKKKMRG